MNPINEMNLEDLKNLDNIKNYKAVTSAQVNTIQGFIRIYIDGSCSVCQTCPSQIRFAYQRLIGWANSNNTSLEQRRVELLELEEKKKPKQCSICNTELDDKRKSYCSKKCKDKAVKAKLKKDDYGREVNE